MDYLEDARTAIQSILKDKQCDFKILPYHEYQESTKIRSDVYNNCHVLCIKTRINQRGGSFVTKL